MGNKTKKQLKTGSVRTPRRQSKLASYNFPRYTSGEVTKFLAAALVVFFVFLILGSWLQGYKENKPLKFMGVLYGLDRNLRLHFIEPVKLLKSSASELTLNSAQVANLTLDAAYSDFKLTWQELGIYARNDWGALSPTLINLGNKISNPVVYGIYDFSNTTKYTLPTNKIGLSEGFADLVTYSAKTSNAIDRVLADVITGQRNLYRYSNNFLNKTSGSLVTTVAYTNTALEKITGPAVQNYTELAGDLARVKISFFKITNDKPVEGSRTKVSATKITLALLVSNSKAWLNEYYKGF